MRRSTACGFSTLAWTVAFLAACGGGGNSTPKVQDQAITPCYGPLTPISGPDTTPTIVPAFDVWQAVFPLSTPRPTATSVPTSRTQGAATATPAPTATPQENILAVSVDTTQASTASQFRLTVACQGTVVVPATYCGQSCAVPPPDSDTDPCMGDERCPGVMVDLNDFGFGDLRRIGCLIEIGPGQALGVGQCADPTRANYRLTVTLNNRAAQSLTLAAHNCRAPESCLHDAFAIQIPPTPFPTPP